MGCFFRVFGGQSSVRTCTHVLRRAAENVISRRNPLLAALIYESPLPPVVACEIHPPLLVRSSGGPWSLVGGDKVEELDLSPQKDHTIGGFCVVCCLSCAACCMLCALYVLCVCAFCVECCLGGPYRHTIPWLFLRTFLNFVLGTPPPPGGPGEGPDCHFPKESVGLGPIPARNRGVMYFQLLFWPDTPSKIRADITLEGKGAPTLRYATVLRLTVPVAPKISPGGQF